MKLPTEQQCQDYFKQYVVPSNVLVHCRKVREFSDFLALKMEEAGIQINREFVSRLAFLHDLLKMVSLKSLESNKFHQHDFTTEEVEMWKTLRARFSGMHEEEAVYEVFKDEFPELAIALRDYNQRDKENPSWEELIVHYADWRTFRNDIVPISERLDYLKEHHSGYDEKWENLYQKIMELEEKIVSIIKLQPEQMRAGFKNE